MPQSPRQSGELVTDAEGTLLYVTYGFARLFDIQRHLIGPNGYGEIVTRIVKGQHAGFDTTISTRVVQHVSGSRAA